MLKLCEQAPATSDYHQPTERMVAEVLQVVREQRDWISALRGQGYKAEVCWGFDEAKDMILNYVGGSE